MTNEVRHAPGKPGKPARWTPGAKCGVGTALASKRGLSLVWFTLGAGIFNEIYYPRPDTPCVRDWELLVSDRREFFSEEKLDTKHKLEYIEPGVPAFRVTNTCKRGRYRIQKVVFAHTRHHALIQRTEFVALQGGLKDYTLFSLLAPHLGGQGSDNTAWIEDYKGVPMLLARREQYSLAAACSSGWIQRSTGYVGVSDGWQQIERDKRLVETYDRAERGNVALIGEIDPAACDGKFVLALGFGGDISEAAHIARSSLLDDLDAVQLEYVRGWQDLQAAFPPLAAPDRDDHEVYRTSIAVMCTHDDKSLGGVTASLAIPWGIERADEDRLHGGYHLVWTRDLVETAGGLLAAGAKEDALRRLTYLQATQEADGHWYQNMWLNGTPFWTALQLCETAMPILLVELLQSEGGDVSRTWPMMRSAAEFIIGHGPTTEEGRWERESGYTPFTLATVITALVAAASMAEEQGEIGLATLWRETADSWNACIEGWLYVTETKLARRMKVEGYYVRVLRPEYLRPTVAGQKCVEFTDEPNLLNGISAAEVVTPDALALVRFGLRAADDPRILNTVKVIDALLKVETREGPSWRRFNGDDYGETPQGDPFPGHAEGGIGRPWPLLTGERAHYELAAGRPQEAERLRRTMAAFANEGHLLPEQIWDAEDLPEHDLFCGRASGSAMPLVWAHAEYVKLCRSLRENRVFDMPRHAAERYQG